MYFPGVLPDFLIFSFFRKFYFSEFWPSTPRISVWRKQGGSASEPAALASRYLLRATCSAQLAPEPALEHAPELAMDLAPERSQPAPEPAPISDLKPFL